MGKLREGLVRMMIVFGTLLITKARDSNPLYDPCSDTEVQKWDGFRLGIAFYSKESFYGSDEVELSPCDTRLQLANKAQLAIFRPRVYEISLLTLNSSTFNPIHGSYLHAGDVRWIYGSLCRTEICSKITPVFVADNSNTITTFTLVVEFQKGTLQNLYWKKFGCGSCNKESHCTDTGQDCAMETSKCNNNTDCTIRIQRTFSGTDKYHDVLNSWYQVKSMRRFSLYGLFTNLRDSLANTFI